MKLYKIIDDATTTLITADRTQALEALYKLIKKYEDKIDYFWIEEDNI